MAMGGTFPTIPYFQNLLGSFEAFSTVWATEGHHKENLKPVVLLLPGIPKWFGFEGTLPPFSLSSKNLDPLLWISLNIKMRNLVHQQRGADGSTRE